MEGLKFAVQRQTEWLSDANFVLRALRSRSTTPFFNALDLAHIGALGHSFGGVVAARLCQTSHTIQACANEDGELFGRALRPGEAVPSLDPTLPVKNPLLIFTLIEPSMKQISEYMQIRRGSRDDLIKFLNTRTSHSYLISIDRPDIRHMSFTYISLLYGGPDRTGSLRLSEFTRKVSLSFFDRFLKRRVSDHLDDIVSDSDVGTTTTHPQ
ncbi:MAG: hypothetical protein JO356_20600 [Acidobacteria bacterium]|nr:hypothetical protein [Acidobacteriota bacterium]